MYPSVHVLAPIQHGRIDVAVRSRDHERGSAMLVTMIVVAALLAGAAALAAVQHKSTRGAEMSRAGLSSLYCAESGLAAARDTVANSYAQWNASLGDPTEPSWLASVSHDLDGDGTADFEITLRDNDDDTPSDPARDNDLIIYIVSKCIKHPDVQTAVTELVRWNGAGNCYQAQLGGCGGNNNAN
jgi:type II secretory pathway pseudopilin PulG